MRVRTRWQVHQAQRRVCHRPERIECQRKRMRTTLLKHIGRQFPQAETQKDETGNLSSRREQSTSRSWDVYAQIHVSVPSSRACFAGQIF
jgi:hypothetical protein